MASLLFHRNCPVSTVSVPRPRPPPSPYKTPYLLMSSIDDSPIYLKRYDADERSILAHRSDASMQSGPTRNGPTGPTASLLARMDANNDDNSEDFRSVIDDLTVQNKKLRRKLKKYERLHCSHLQEEKLFEVRIHGLPAHKRRELEDTLKRFASGIEEESPHKHRHIGDPLFVPRANSPLHKPSSSSTFCSGPLDSAYASLSSSGNVQAHSENRPAPRATQQNVESYLHDIPKPTVLQHSLGMSDKTKRKLVVQRLEQIFTGSGAVSHGVKQSHQQQEVSTAAAEAEKSKLEACGQKVWKEGTREAHILPDGADLKVENVEEPHRQAQRSRDNADGSDTLSRATEVSRAASPDQRPTRPLDLDLYRAQNPSDNIEYIRHLGLASPTPHGANHTLGADDGWVYLNLLTSMAQLHTLNVTPEFIRKAVTQVSTKLELSIDGTKVRWLGGADGTRMSSDGDESESHSHLRSAHTSLSVSKRGSYAERSTPDGPDRSSMPTSDLLIPSSQSPALAETVARRRPVQAASADNQGSFHYKPLFFHTAQSTDEDDSGDGSTSLSSACSIELATGLNSSSNAMHERQTRLRGRKHEHGPIIFYKRARFCTDLGGDPEGPIQDEVSYTRYTDHALGHTLTSSSGKVEKEAANSTDVHEAGFMDSDPDGPSSTRTALDLEDLLTSISDCSRSHDAPLQMEASGLYRIQPDDNFVVNVQTQHMLEHTSFNSPETVFIPQVPIHRPLHRIPIPDIKSSVGEHVSSQKDTPIINSRVISAVKTIMAPSALPPPSYARLAYSSSDSDEENHVSGMDEDEVSNMVRTARRPSANQNVTHPHLAPQGLFMGSGADTETKESSYGSASSGDDSESIDLLAHARVQDPEAVKASEREFDDDRRSQQLAGPKSGVLWTGRHFGSEDSDSDMDSMSVYGEMDESD